MASLLYKLRNLSPKRPLTFGESFRVAELQANRLLEWRGIETPPVPDDLVTRFPRVQVETVATLGVSGATTWSDGRWQILINGGETANRRRFSAFHELKHILDYPHAELRYSAVPGMSSGERQEQIADYFAAATLMPRHFVQRAWGNGTQDVRDLAKLFAVSREAMNYRSINLGLIERTRRCEVAA